MTFRGEQDARDADRWFRWMLLFGGLGILATVGLQFLAFAWCDRDESRKSHDWMKDQMQRLRQGEINCLVDPDPRSLEELLADAAAAAAVRDVYLGGDLSDPRLAGLRELPNLKCIVFIFADHHKEFLQRMHGAAAIEELSFDCTPLERADVESDRQLSPLESAGHRLRLALDEPAGSALRQRFGCAPRPSVAGTAVFCSRR